MEMFYITQINLKYFNFNFNIYYVIMRNYYVGTYSII